MCRELSCAVALLALTTGGCALEPGSGFATIEDARLSAKLEPGEARDLGNGGVQSDLGYEVRLDSAELVADEVLLETLSSGSGEASFDPADPPPGYSLCHNGHCHADDGRLVDYAEIEAELGGTGSSFTPVAMLPYGGGLDLLGGAQVALERVEPSRELPRVRLRKVALHVSRITLRGEVSAGPAGSGLAAPASLDVDIAVAEDWDHGIDLVIDRDEPGAIDLSVGLVVGGRVFDGVDFAAHASTGQIAVTAGDHPLATQLVASLGESELSFATRPH
jgi:hypothetical protein